jgi:hypothetical protein
MPDWTLVATSHFILLPTFAYLNAREYVCASLIFGTYLTSIVHHSTKPAYPLALYADMTFVQIANLCGIYTTVKSLPYSIPLYLCFISCPLTVYYYGYQHSILAWDPDPIVSTRWHAFIHGFTSCSSTIFILVTTLTQALGHSRIPHSH